MTRKRLVQTDDQGARILSRLIRENADSSTVIASPQTAAPNAGNIVVAEPVELPSKDPEGVVNNRTIRSLNGATWSDTGQGVPVRRITNGRQLAFPVANLGRCVVDGAFWAINIGSLAAPTLTITSTGSGSTLSKTISGVSTSGIAAVLEVQSDGNLKSTADRLAFVRWDDGGTIADGTLIQLGYVSGTLTLLFANCAATSGLTGLTASPEAP